MSGNEGMFGPQRMWMLLGAAVVLLSGWKLLTPAPQADAEPMALLNVIENGEGRIEKVSRTACLQQEGRVWITLEDGVECISYVTAGTVEGAPKVLVLLHGDIPEAQMAKEAPASARVTEQASAEGLSRRFEIPVITIGRPGIMGSTGFHLVGGRRDEASVIDATLAALKEKLRLGRLAMAGQSGGARLIAQMMVLGHHDIACAAMGSGAYGVPGLKGGGQVRTDMFGNPGRRYLVPLLEVARIAPDAGRRSFVIGDTDDQVAAFEEQRAWADELGKAGHSVVVIEGRARDLEHHGMMRQALTAAAMCAKGATDAEIVTAVRAL